MKHYIALIGMICIILLSAFHNPAAATKGTGDNDNSSLRRKIDRHVVFPVFQQENMQGTVDVSFQIDDEGHLKIIQINSSNPDLIDYVVNKLKKIQLDKEDGNVGQTIKYRFVFKKQA